MKTFITLMLCIAIGATCKKSNTTKDSFTQTTIDLPTHSLTAFSATKNTEYLIVFETGLGDDHTIWNQKNIPLSLIAEQDIVIYDRSGYGRSSKGPLPRTMSQLSSDLGAVVSRFANGRKVVLVAHSLGGMIVRDYAIKNPTNVAGMLLIEPSHEAYNNPSQAQEDLIYNAFLQANGVDFGGTLEARELIEYSNYMATLSNLPNIPIVVLTSMRVDASHSATDRQQWFNAHAQLGTGLTDFTHLTTINAGHYIFLDEPNFVLENIRKLLSRLP